jgi:hypothetical protein
MNLYLKKSVYFDYHKIATSIVASKFAMLCIAIGTKIDSDLDLADPNKIPMKNMIPTSIYPY